MSSFIMSTDTLVYTTPNPSQAHRTKRQHSDDKSSFFVSLLQFISPLMKVFQLAREPKAVTDQRASEMEI